jgi:predicted O-linked N-acetylglucosamine transferase (SPINDLY family)
MAGLFEQHDRTRFETVAISFGPDFSDYWRARLVASVDRFEDLRLCSDREIAARIRELEVDIAVDLKGHTSDARPGILQHRPAPVQVSYLGFPGTTGLSEMDYLIADRVLVPESDELFYTEKIVRLPDSYQVNDNQRPISPQTFTRAQLGLPAQSFIFCCFNSSYKITPEVFAVWMRLLHGVEGSVLWLLADSSAVQRNLRDEAARQGVEPQRLIFASRLAPAEHLARLQLADLFLDTLPCNAHTTASDSLWAGLPILTCAGESFAGRVCASLLTAVGLPELVSHSLQAYEALARELATDSVKYQGIRERLAANRSRAALFDTRRFTRHLEQAYCIVRERQLRGEAPASFSVEASPESPGVSP